MVRGEVIASEKVGADDWLLNVGDDEVEWVILATQSDSMSDTTITGDCGAISGGELGPVRTFFAPLFNLSRVFSQACGVW